MSSIRSSDPILDHTRKCLEDHIHQEWGDRPGLDAFNRLLAKQIEEGMNTQEREGFTLAAVSS